jgi:protoheme IX farnesyltransferase
MNRLHHRLALLLAGATLALVFVGGLVTSTQSGLAVPDWPLSYGRVFPPMRGAVLFEHGHRLLAASIGFLTLLTALAFQRFEGRRWLRRAAWGALGLVVLQGLFGGITVLLKLKKPAFSVVHACLAQTFFSLTVALAAWSSRAWEEAPARPPEPEGATPLHLAGLLLFAALYAQLILGAVIRHTGLAVLAHMLNPLLILVLVGVMVSRAGTASGESPALTRCLWSLPAAFLAQVVLGVLTYFIVSPGTSLAWARPVRVAVVTAHVAMGALFLGLAALSALFSYRTRPGAGRAAGAPGLAADYMTLTKPGISLMTAITALAGYLLGARGKAEGASVLSLAIGTLLVSGGACALNMWKERDIDGRMRRTETRPLPARRLTPGEGLFFGAVLSLAGLACLAFYVNLLTAGLAGATLAVYIYLYTPLKTRSPFSTGVGAVSGALPPVMGWAAATGRVGWEALALFAVLFFWQFPHFYALAWMYRDDYARAGFPLLPVVEPDGDSTARKMVTHSFALLTVSLLPAFFGMTGRLYPAAVVGLGAALTALASLFFVSRTRPAARRVFLGSVMYLPILLAILLLDRPA